MTTVATPAAATSAMRAATPAAASVGAASGESLPSDPLAGVAHRATEELVIEIEHVVTTTH